MVLKLSICSFKNTKLKSFFRKTNKLFGIVKIIILSLTYQIKNMATKAKVLTIGEQIKAALDGRSQRWLGQKLDLTDDAISRRMNGILEFTDEEIETINHLLSLNIKK